MLAAFWFVRSPALFVPLYFISGILDAFDGMAARHFHQSTRFGAVLDMVTDRAATAGLCVHLAQLYPRLTFAMQFLVALDMASHYMQMYATLSAGKTSHKSVTRESHGPVLFYYYTVREVMFVVCLANEAFYVLAYLEAYRSLSLLGDSARMALLLVLAPFWGFKQGCNVVQMVSAARLLASLEKSQ